MRKSSMFGEVPSFPTAASTNSKDIPDGTDMMLMTQDFCLVPFGEPGVPLV